MVVFHLPLLGGDADAAAQVFKDDVEFPPVHSGGDRFPHLSTSHVKGLHSNTLHVSLLMLLRASGAIVPEYLLTRPSSRWINISVVVKRITYRSSFDLSSHHGLSR
jgi:hypothetical protein